MLDAEGWRVTVTAAELDASALVAAANEFNEVPGDNEQYALVSLTIERTGSVSTAIDLGIELVVNDDRLPVAPAVAPTPLHLLNQFEPDAAVAGQVAFIVPAGTDSAEVLVSLSPSRSYLVPVK